MLEGKLKKVTVGLAAILALACGDGSCGGCSLPSTPPPSKGNGYLDHSNYKTNADADGCRDGCYKENPKEECCWCPD